MNILCRIFGHKKIWYVETQWKLYEDGIEASYWFCERCGYEDKIMLS